MCADIDEFISTTTLDSPIDIVLGDNFIIKATARGTVSIKSVNDRRVELANTLYVPDSRCNLISISRRNDSGCSILFNKGICQISRSNHVLFVHIFKRNVCIASHVLTQTIKNFTIQHDSSGNPKQYFKYHDQITGLERLACLFGTYGFCQSPETCRRHYSLLPHLIP